MKAWFGTRVLWAWMCTLNSPQDAHWQQQRPGNSRRRPNSPICPPFLRYMWLSHVGFVFQQKVFLLSVGLVQSPPVCVCLSPGTISCSVGERGTRQIQDLDAGVSSLSVRATKIRPSSARPWTPPLATPHPHVLPFTPWHHHPASSLAHLFLPQPLGPWLCPASLSLHLSPLTPPRPATPNSPHPTLTPPRPAISEPTPHCPVP